MANQHHAGDVLEQGMTRAGELALSGDIAGARALVEEMIRSHGTGTGAYNDDATVEFRNFASGTEAALYIASFTPTRQVRRLPPDRAALYRFYGWILIEQRDPVGAEAALREALRYNPVSTSILYELGEVMKLTGRSQEFREITAQAMEFAADPPGLARGYRNFGFLAIEEHDYELAIACFFVAMAFDPSNTAMARNELEVIEQRSGTPIRPPELEAAQAQLARAGIRLGPSDAVMRVMAAEAQRA